MAAPLPSDAPQRTTNRGAAGPVLILRSCRPDRFAAAVQVARDRHPESEIVALSHAGHEEALRKAGVDRVIVYPGTRFTILGTAPWHWLRLRAEKYEEVIVPTMTADARAHGNLHWVAAALRCRSVLLLPGDQPADEREHGQFVQLLFDDILRRAPRVLDILVFLGILATACFRRRRQTVGSPPRRRVLHVIPSLGVGGAQRQLFEVINATPPDRFDVDVVVLCDFGAGFARQWLTRNDVSIRVLTEYPTLTLLTRELTRHCAGGRYDVVHTWLWLANWVGAAAARLAGVPRVITSVRSLSVNNRALGYGGWWHRPADILGSRAADVVTVNADALARNYARWALRRRRSIRVIHNGLDPSQFLADRRTSRRRLLDATGAADDAVLIGSVGRLSPEKNHGLFLQIVERVRRTHPSVHGVLVGDGAKRHDLERQRDALGLRDAVTFLGERTDPVRVTAGLDLFVLPSAIEGFPNALLEAMFLGIPAIATRVGGNDEVIGDRTLTFEVDAPDDAVTAVLTLLDDGTASAACAARLQARALTTFTAERATAEWLRLYDRCLHVNATTI